ncbi:MAG: hypothetical protein Kow0090_04470 [Myxococcota bacterium]
MYYRNRWGLFSTLFVCFFIFPSCSKSDVGEKADDDKKDGGEDDGDAKEEKEEGEGETESVILEEGELKITFNTRYGAFDIEKGGVKVFENATADVLYNDGGRRDKTFTFGDECEISQDGESAFECKSERLLQNLEFGLPEGKGYITMRLTVTNNSGGNVNIKKLTPLLISPENDGRLFIGGDPARHRILDNGSFVAFDPTPLIQKGDVKRFGLADALPIPIRGNSAANWNHIVADMEDPSRSLVAGYLTFDKSIPTLGIAYNKATATPNNEGDIPFTLYAAESAMIFHGKILAPGESVSSEVLYLDPLPEDPLKALEKYAVEVAAYHNYTPWAKRGEGYTVPNGWNSWTGGASAGGYGASINEELIISSLEVYKREFGPFGAAYYQLDDGWQKATGDWVWNAERFPNGGKWLADQFAAAGFIPGIWIQPFQALPDSQTAQEHPDWLMPKEDITVGAFCQDYESVDLTNPEVQEFLKETLSRLKEEGFRWIKLDFTYNAMLCKPQYDKSLTNIEAWKKGYFAMREALGEEVFMLGVGIMGANIGVIDGMRLTMDNGPRWEEDTPEDMLGSPRSFKNTVRVGTRRWFYQNRIWVNHNDLIFFREWPNGEYPPITLGESRAFATWIGLGGGIVKIGDKLLDMQERPEWIDIIRRLLPVWADGTTPLDVLTRDYPEQYRGHISAKAGEWEWVGLCNWGINRDLSTEPYTQLGEERRIYRLDCKDECLVYEFWGEEFLGKKKGSFEVEVEPRNCKVLALRSATGVPQFLGTNRHITIGATDISELEWDSGSKTLTGKMLGAVGTEKAPWEYHLAFYLPTEFKFKSAEVEMAETVRPDVSGETIKLFFSLPPSAQDKEVTFKLQFE